VLGGPQRVTPHFDVWLVNLAGVDRTQVRWDLGYVRADESRRFDEQQGWIAELGRQLAED
jgi:hypothetical protein